MDSRRLRPGAARAAVPAALLALASLAPLALAHEAPDDGEHGELILHLERDASGCQVTVTGRGIDASDATLRFLAPAKNAAGREPVHEEEVALVPDEERGGFRFTRGPYSFDQSFLWAELRWTEDGVEHSVDHIWDNAQCRHFSQLRVHERADGPVVREISGCEFFVEGRHVRVDGGELRLNALRGPGDDPRRIGEVASDDMRAEEDGDGRRFLVGPFEAPEDGRFQVQLVVERDGQEQVAAASSFFEVERCSTTPPACPPNLEAEPSSGRPIFVDWDGVNAADGYRVYRSTGGGAEELVAEVDVDFFSDTEVEPGTTYQYRVTAFNEQGESAGCATVEATAIPVFGAPLVAALALVGGLGAFAMLRRRG